MNRNRATLATIAISMGDPAGIGPEVVVKALAELEISRLAQWIIVGNSSVLQSVESMTGLALQNPPDLRVVDLRQPHPSELSPGKLSSACGRAALEYIREATRLCLQGEADAMVTAPVNKEAVNLTEQKFSGHTEFIGELCGVSESRMMLVNERLRVVHVSTHVALRRACDLAVHKILKTIQLAHEALQGLGFDRPRIAVCGLNPHAGESGLFGDEDLKFVAPAVKAAQAAGLDCEGPFPADTIILKAVRGAYDLVVAMYHDQGHVPMKLLDFEHTVNVTLGLPIIRTSVDHGTAFDIAGKNKADPTSMRAAMRLAAEMARQRLPHTTSSPHGGR
jgi:4-hydroxythreonine-4-phosphate dehydrogenase